MAKNPFGQREGMVAPNRGQDIYWLIPTKFAIGIGHGGMIEIFSAHPNKDFACGYKFRFEFTFYDANDMINSIRNVVQAGRDMKAPKWPQLIAKINSLKGDGSVGLDAYTNLFEQKPIDRTFLKERWGTQSA